MVIFRVAFLAAKLPGILIVAGAVALSLDEGSQGHTATAALPDVLAFPAWAYPEHDFGAGVLWYVWHGSGSFRFGDGSAGLPECIQNVTAARLFAECVHDEMIGCAC